MDAASIYIVTLCAMGMLTYGHYTDLGDYQPTPGKLKDGNEKDTRQNWNNIFKFEQMSVLNIMVNPYLKVVVVKSMKKTKKNDELFVLYRSTNKFFKTYYYQ